MRRILRVAAWNVLLAAAGFALTAAAGEAYFRAFSDIGFPKTHRVKTFVPGVGLMWQPHSELRRTNGLDFWQTTRVNSQGFLDREPDDARAAAAACRVAVIGDSFVQGEEVPIADKLHIRLEEIAAERLPGVGVAASAFGKGDTGQVAQIPYYDHYARAMRPNLIVLVFVSNDFKDNSAPLKSAREGWDPQSQPYASAFKRRDGSVALRLPDPDYASKTLPISADLLPAPLRALEGVKDRFLSWSLFAKWVYSKLEALSYGQIEDRRAALIVERAKLLSERPCCENILVGWSPAGIRAIDKVFRQESLPPVFQDAVEYTAFALDEFKARADRDGARLVILSSYRMNTRGDPMFDRMSAMAQERGLPVIDQYAYIVRQGHAIEDAHFQHDAHWSANGHLWAAEALMEWMERNSDVCGDE